MNQIKEIFLEGESPTLKLGGSEAATVARCRTAWGNFTNFVAKESLYAWGFSSSWSILSYKE